MWCTTVNVKCTVKYILNDTLSRVVHMLNEIGVDNRIMADFS